MHACAYSHRESTPPARPRAIPDINTQESAAPANISSTAWSATCMPSLLANIALPVCVCVCVCVRACRFNNDI